MEKDGLYFNPFLLNDPKCVSMLSIKSNGSDLAASRYFMFNRLL